MLIHHLKFFVRKIKKDLVSYFLGYTGLIVGLSMFTLLGIYSHQQFSHGRYVSDHERIYRANVQLERQGNISEFALGYGFLVDVLTSDFPEVESATRLMRIQSQSIFRVGERMLSIEEGNGFYADEYFFEVFDMPTISRSKTNMLRTTNAIVLTESFAKRLFGDQDPVGQVVEDVWGDGSHDLLVTGLIKDLPNHSHFQFEYLITGSVLGYWDYLTRPNVGNANYIYYKTVHPIDPATFDEKLAASASKIQKKPTSINSVALSDIHFAAPVLFEHTTTADKEQIILISFAGILLLFTSIINFLMIHLSQLIDRTKEFRIKKAMGISSGQWVSQLFVESFLAVLIIAVSAVITTYYLHQYFFSDMIGKEWAVIMEFELILGTIMVILMILLIIFISSIIKLHTQFRSTNPDHTRVITSRKGGVVQHVTLTVQFSFVMLTIVGSYFVWKQLNHLQDLPMGYQTDWKINVTRPQDAKHSTWGNFKQSLSQSPSVTKSGSSLNKWMASDYNSTPLRVLTENPTDTSFVQVQYNYINDQLISTLGLEILDGRNFDRNYATDTFNILLNETAAKAFGYDVIGKDFESKIFDERSGKVIGIVKDFHFQSMDKAIPPVALMFHRQDLYKENLVIQLSKKNIQESINNVEAAWNQSGIISPFEYTFLDQFQARLFERETQNAQFMGITASCSILVALIGLIGLVSFQNKRRSKELSLRKVFGASVRDLLLMINRSYLTLVGLSVLLSLPIAYWAVSQWLNSYAYRISPSVMDFMIITSGVLLVSLLTVSIQSWKTANTNPTDVLRSE